MRSRYGLSSNSSNSFSPPRSRWALLTQLCGAATHRLRHHGGKMVGLDAVNPSKKTPTSSGVSTHPTRECQLFQAKATLSRTRVPNRSEERATALPASAR